MKKSVGYKKNLLEDLKNPLEAEAYLNAAIEAGDRAAFLLALRNVLDAHAPMAEVARKTKIHRVSLHKMFARQGNPTAESLIALFRVLGIKLRIQRPRTARNLDKAA
jgi:probable addiction module antidote protein